MSQPERIPSIEELVNEIRCHATDQVPILEEQHADWCKRIREAHMSELSWGTCAREQQFVRVVVNQNHTTVMDWFELLRREFEFGVQTAEDQESGYKGPLRSKHEWEMLSAFVQDLAKRFPADEELQAKETKSYNLVSQEKANRRVDALLEYISTLGDVEAKVAKTLLNGVS